MEKRIKHERNHQDKKSFMCRVCKSKFQSSFDLNVHLVHGCQNFTPGVKRPAMKPELRKPATIQEKNRVKVNGSTKVQEGLQTGTAKPKTQVPLKCKICNKVYSNGVNKQFNKHVQNCKRSLSMSKMHDIRRKLKLQKLVSVDKVPQTLAVNEQGRKKVCKVFSEDVKVRPLLRRKRKTVNVQALSTAETSLSANVEKSPKASLLHSLGLQEKQNQGLEIHNTSKPDEVMKNFRAAPEVINCDGDEVVTVCDICRKIFTSETGMLNHQMSVHNRNLTAEKMHSLMRVEI
ncbi:hypothetical protein C0J52_08081 [Blattella germanica]|nr:hypothetical protein C0J52_08081 [Blattella germanica]